MKESFFEKLVSFWRGVGKNNGVVMVIDAVGFALSAWIAFSMRWTLYFPSNYWSQMLTMMGTFIVCQIGAMLVCRVYRIYWPFASLEELLLLGRSFLYGYVVFLGLQFSLGRLTGFSRAILIIMPVFGMGSLLLTRLSWRLPLKCHAAGLPERVVIVGAGEAGNILARDLIRQGGRGCILGFVDDDAQKLGKRVAGIRVFGPLSSIEKIIERLKPETVIVAMPSAPLGKTRGLLDQLVDLGVNVRFLPSMKDLASGAVSVSQLKPVSLEDLLCRSPIEMDLERLDGLVKGKSVLVTGAGGSIGSEIVRQLLLAKPQKIVLLGHGENSIYQLLEELGPKAQSVQLVPVIADVVDRPTMKRVFEKHRPSVVFHAGAHKHVPLMEDNPREAVRVNGLGTWTVADLAGQFGVERFVMISTDKAVNPSSVMGASKRLAELVVQDIQKKFPQTFYMAVRFGNVLGSRGSVIPKFERQIAAGGPVTVTHPDMCRYFMLIPEAAKLVLEAASIGNAADIFVLDMGDPVKIVDLARAMIRLHGLVTDQDVKIEFCGCRPGEKLFEELFYDPAHVERTSHMKIFRARLDSFNFQGPVEGVLQGIMTAPDIRQAIRSVVPEYAPNAVDAS